MRGLYGGGLPPHEKTRTSKEAAECIAGIAGTLRGKVYALIAASGEYGMTDDEIETVSGLIHQTASARRRELVDKLHLIVDSGRVRKTRSGRNATVWIVVPKGSTEPPKQERLL
jgi:hypothetical protein